jgi:hypothetical protein
VIEVELKQMYSSQRIAFPAGKLQFISVRELLKWRTAGYALLLLILLGFPYGPLFPWSPVHPGYREQRFNRSRVIYPSGIELPDDYIHVDDYIARAESFHFLPMPSRITVILCRDWTDFERFMPQIRSRAVAAVALMTGTVIYVTPKVQEKRLDTREYLLHELSHAALHQNQSWLAALRVSRQQWFAEGLAVSFGEQKSYVTPQEFLNRAQKLELGPIIDPDQRAAATDPFDMRLGYQTWRYFLEHLIDTHGRGLFQRFMTAYIAQPDEYRTLFSRVYGVPFAQAIQQFQEDIRMGKWRPTPDFVSSHLK